MKYGFVHHPTIAQMLDNYSLEQLGRDAGVPNTFRVNDDDRSANADTEARCFASLHTRGPEEEILPLEQPREQAVKCSTATIGRAESASAHEHVAAIGLHLRLANGVLRHRPTPLHSDAVHMTP